MGVHVFGGTSSPEYCIYAVRTAIDNAPNYDTEVAETLLNNSIVTLLFWALAQSGKWNRSFWGF